MIQPLLIDLILWCLLLAVYPKWLKKGKKKRKYYVARKNVLYCVLASLSTHTLILFFDYVRM